MINKKYFLLSALILVATTTFAANPASQSWVLQQIQAAISKLPGGSNSVTQEWVLQQIQAAIANLPPPTQLTTADWNAACTSGSPSDFTGCFGNVSSAAFTKVSNGVGGFTTYSNINSANAPDGSVFIKAFLAGTNTPIGAVNLTVTLSNGSAARCALFTQVGLGIGPQGISSDTPASGGTSGSTPPPHTAVIVSINDATSTNDIDYNGNAGVAAVVPAPIYLICAGYNSADGSTATSITNNITAT